MLKMQKIHCIRKTYCLGYGSANIQRLENYERTDIL